MTPKEPTARVRMRFRSISVEVQGDESSVVQQLAGAIMQALRQPDELDVELVTDERPHRRPRRPLKPSR